MVYPSLKDYNALPNTSSFEEWRTQSVNKCIHYSQLEYTSIEETPAVTLANSISRIGGTMSIIISVSFFTILEIGELFVFQSTTLLLMKGDKKNWSNLHVFIYLANFIEGLNEACLFYLF